MATDQELVAHLDQVWGSIADLGSTLDEGDWKTPTEVPGWTVQDNLAHIVALEWLALGRAAPDHDIPDDLPHVKNDFGRANEVFVDSRRDRSGADVLAEFRTITAERLAQLRSFGPDDFGAASFTPVGPGTVRDLLPFRVFDSWVHEQDMRRAVDRPGHLEGPVADAAFARVVAAMPFVVGKKAQAAQGSTVVFDVTAPLAQRFAIGIDGRAQLLDDVPTDVTARITTDGETFARLACGRLDPTDALAGGAVHLDGDEALGRRVVESLNFLF
ncbi:MAG TPA: maleylpyruvate isomerase family mycothiol-dependent enzyme [Acidimicrobiia bacterium]|nr:maleylpyruvate isomerase family mycothiol-dependent enzyme [Acidimicrobiia bacterium]